MALNHQQPPVNGQNNGQAGGFENNANNQYDGSRQPQGTNQYGDQGQFEGGRHHHTRQNDGDGIVHENDSEFNTNNAASYPPTSDGYAGNQQFASGGPGSGQNTTSTAGGHGHGVGADNDFTGLGRYNATNAGTNGPNSGLQNQPGAFGAASTGRAAGAGTTGPGGTPGNTANMTSTGTTANTHGILGKLQHAAGDVLDAPELQRRGLQKEQEADALKAQRLNQQGGF
ncbi:hypothetical protein SISSUDRAFT_1119364 [Sistotremastrum suecicum HHB10207 ss-3]|uniref:CsbD-like domain-containing protein n=1 Tax=Sistotremastrum suecicum HHB10207 ss-3 TaxID=1314776 RepID=A0A166DRZ1_9AGAM|nr:hypothetical protein SISSUDRAFT_1119364 [Sistotremastrum suecicum HHB10207 ss-3]